MNAAFIARIFAVLLALCMPSALQAQDEPEEQPGPFRITGGFDAGTRAFTGTQGGVLFTTTCDDENGTGLYFIPDGSNTAEEWVCDGDGKPGSLLFAHQSGIFVSKPTALAREKFGLFEVKPDADGHKTFKLAADLGADVSHVARLGSRLLIGTSGKGLHLLADGSTITAPVGGVPAGAYVWCISVIGDRAYIGGQDGLWTLGKDETTATRLGGDFSDTTCITHVGNRILIGGRDGGIGGIRDGDAAPFWIPVEHPDDRIQPWNHQAELKVNVIAAFGEDALLGTNYGVWLLKGGTDDCKLLGGVPKLADVDHIQVIGHTALAGTSVEGLWAYSGGDAWQRVKLNCDEDGVFSIAAAENRFLVSTKHGIFQFSTSGEARPWEPKCKVTWQVPGKTPVAPVTARVHIELEDVNGLVDKTRAPFKVAVFKKGSGKDSIVGTVEKTGTSEATFDLDSEGTYYATAQVASALGRWSKEIRISGEGDGELRVYPSQAAVAAAMVKEIGAWSLLVWALSTLGLVTASRWSPFAFRLVTSPSIPKVAQWYGPLFEHVRPVRLWMLERAYQKLRTGFREPPPFVEPMAEVGGGGGPEGALEMLTKRFRKPGRGTSSPGRRLLLKGHAGTGKSTLIEKFLSELTDPSSLQACWAAHGVVPFLIRVRDYGAGEVVDAVAASLESYGIEDKKLVQRLLRTGDFLLILDGANERNWDEAIKAFTVRFPETPLLVTSQSAIELAETEVWTLPPFDAVFAKSVLAAHLPPAGLAQAANVPGELWPDIRSGYDVTLLVELLRNNGRLPASKVGLYEAVIDCARSQWHGTPPFSELLTNLYHKGFDQWKSAAYDLEASPSLPKPFLDHMVEKHVLSEAGPRYQFRHELMRQYLAACWLVRESSSIEDLVARLGDKDIWALGASQQRDVMIFVASLLGTDAALRAAAKFVGENIGQRAILADALHREAIKRNLPLDIPLN